MKSVIYALLLTLAFSTSAVAEIIIDDFSTQFGASGGGPLHSLEVIGSNPFDEYTDLAPAGAIGSRHEWLEGWDFQYPGVVNDLYILDFGAPFGSMLSFGGFDYNLKLGVDYGTEAPLNLDLSTEAAFLIDLVFSDIPAATMTFTVESGTGSGSLTIYPPMWEDMMNPMTLELQFALFSGSIDWSDVDVIRFEYVTINEFGPDAVFDNFRTFTDDVVPTENSTLDQLKAFYR